MIPAAEIPLPDAIPGGDDRATVSTPPDGRTGIDAAPVKRLVAAQFPQGGRPGRRHLGTGQGLGPWKALLVLSECADTDQERAAATRTVIAEVLADHDRRASTDRPGPGLTAGRGRRGGPPDPRTP